MSAPIDISKYKCVPLDLLKNISPENQVQFDATGPDGVSLVDINNKTKTSLVNAGVGSGTYSAAALENIMVTFIVLLVIGLFIVGLYCYILYKNSGSSSLPFPKEMPAIALFGTITFCIGLGLGTLIPKAR